MLNPPLQIIANSVTGSEASGGWTAAQTATLLAALLAAAAAFYGTHKTGEAARAQAARDSRDKTVTFRRQQLNDLYGPIRSLRLASESTYNALRARQGLGPAGTLPRWALVDHIEEIRDADDPFTVLAVKNILEFNSQISELLKSKYGLLFQYPEHESFTKFIAHTEQLRLAWEQKVNLPKKDRVSFPVETFDAEINRVIAEIRQQLEATS